MPLVCCNLQHKSFRCSGQNSMLGFWFPQATQVVWPAESHAKQVRRTDFSFEVCNVYFYPLFQGTVFCLWIRQEESISPGVAATVRGWRAPGSPQTQHRGLCGTAHAALPAHGMEARLFCRHHDRSWAGFLCSAQTFWPQFYFPFILKSTRFTARRVNIGSTPKGRHLAKWVVFAEEVMGGAEEWQTLKQPFWDCSQLRYFDFFFFFFIPVSSNTTFLPLCLSRVSADRTELLVANTLFIVIECLVITLYIFSILKLKPFTSRNRC